MSEKASFSPARLAEGQGQAVGEVAHAVGHLVSDDVQPAREGLDLAGEEGARRRPLPVDHEAHVLDSGAAVEGVDEEEGQVLAVDVDVLWPRRVDDLGDRQVGVVPASAAETLEEVVVREAGVGVGIDRGPVGPVVVRVDREVRVAERDLPDRGEEGLEDVVLHVVGQDAGRPEHVHGLEGRAARGDAELLVVVQDAPSPSHGRGLPTDRGRVEEQGAAHRVDEEPTDVAAPGRDEREGQGQASVAAGQDGQLRGGQQAGDVGAPAPPRRRGPAPRARPAPPPGPPRRRVGPTRPRRSPRGRSRARPRPRGPGSPCGLARDAGGGGRRRGCLPSYCPCAVGLREPSCRGGSSSPSPRRGCGWPCANRDRRPRPQTRREASRLVLTQILDNASPSGDSYSGGGGNGTRPPRFLQKTQPGTHIRRPRHGGFAWASQKRDISVTPVPHCRRFLVTRR